MTVDDGAIQATTRTYRVAADEQLSAGVVRAVSAATGYDPVPGTFSGSETDRSLDPLSTVIDAEALDALFGPTAANGSRGDGRVTFTYHDHTVTVESTGTITVEAP